MMSLCLAAGMRAPRVLECEVFPGAFNYLDLAALVKAIREVDWDDPDGVQLFVQEQEERRLREVDLGLSGR